MKDLEIKFVSVIVKLQNKTILGWLRVSINLVSAFLGLLLGLSESSQAQLCYWSKIFKSSLIGPELKSVEYWPDLSSAGCFIDS